MSIHDEPRKINSSILRFLDSQKGHDLMVILVIIGVAVGGFCLGVLSVQKDDSTVTIKADPSQIVAVSDDNNSSIADNSSSNINHEKNNSTEKTTQQNLDDKSGEVKLPYVASKKGKKYYPVDCPAVGNLSKANLIYFKDMADAESRGYSSSSSCH